MFTIRVGNIAPSERVTVRLTLSQPLPCEDGDVTFRFPLVVAPRYIPGSPLDCAGHNEYAPAGSGVAPDTDAVPDASRITPPVLLPGFPNPVRLTISADIDPAGPPLAEIRCSLHAVAEHRDADGHTIIRLHLGERLDRDFILRMSLSDTERTVTSLVLTPDPEKGEDPPQGCFALTLVPPRGAVRPRSRDVVLVLDRSGSMHGWKMVAARRAAALARLEHEITGVSLRYGVLCRFTAFVAVDSSVVTDGKAPHRVTQPVELPSGWVLQSVPTAPVPAASAVAGGVAPAPAAPRPRPGPRVARQLSGRGLRAAAGGTVRWKAAGSGESGLAHAGIVRRG